MSIEKFIPKSPDRFIRNSQDFEVARFGHLNEIISCINAGCAGGGLELSGNGLISSTLKSVLDPASSATPLLISNKSITNYGGGAVTSNTAFGEGALYANTTGNGLSAFGTNVLQCNTTGSK